MKSPFMDEAVGEALATLSVALRTPIMTISTATQMALGSEDPTEIREQLFTVESAVDSLNAILGDLLDAAELASGTLQFHVVPFRLPDTIKEAVGAVGPLAADRDLELSVHGLTALPTDLVGDPGRLRQVLTHLVTNAVSLTDEGKVQVGAKVVAQDPNSVAVRFAIRSRGIDTADGSAFEGAGPGVSALGVAIARLVIELMGGTAETSTRQGEGTVVSFTLEFDRPHQSASSESASGAWVVVVSSEETGRLLSDALRHGGFEPSVFPSVPVASAAAALSDVPGEVPAAAIVAPGSQPFEAAERFLADAHLGSVPVMLIPSLGERGDGSRCATMGVSAYLPRPLSPIDLIEATRALVARGSEPGPLITRHWLRERRRTLDILVVDDSPTGRAVIMRSLTRLGHRCTAAATGLDAIQAIQRKRPDAVIMDMEMPELGGVEATRAIRAGETRGRLPIIGLSAHASDEDKRLCLEAGMDIHMAKPFQIAELQMAIERLTTSQ